MIMLLWEKQTTTANVVNFNQFIRLTTLRLYRCQVVS